MPIEAAIWASHVLDGIATLVDQSLLRLLEQTSGDPRFGMLATIREYALQQLADSGEAEIVRGCHASYFLALSEAIEPELLAPVVHKQAIARLQLELDNLRAAIAWTLQLRPAGFALPAPIGERIGMNVTGDSGTLSPADLGLRLAGALAWFGLVGEHVGEVRTWLAAALQQAAGPGPAQAKALWGAGLLAMAQGDYAEARTVLLQSVALHRQGGDQLGVARALRELCMTAYAEHDLLASQRYGEEGVAIFRALGSTMDLAVTLDDLAATYVAQGQYAAARTLYEEEYVFSLSVGEPSYSALALVGLGMIAAQLADDGTAVAHLERAQVIQRELGEKWVLASTLHLLGEVVQRRGEWERAAGLYRESLLLAQAVGDKANMAQVLHQIGTLAHAQRQDQPAAHLFAAAAAQRTASGGATFYTLANAGDRADAIATVRARLGEESFAACWAQGQAMPLEQVVALALQAADVPPAPASPREDSPPAMLLPAGFAHLTRREIEVLRLLAQGLTYAQIADKLVVSHRTVNAHVTSIYAKLGVTSRADATRLAAEHKLM